MNYTKNHHLPQWDETDRIMRTDFNQMCADIESGLNAAGNGLDTAVAEFREGLAQSQEADQVFDRRFLRLMYNHYSMLRSIEPFPRQMGVFYQNPAQDTSVTHPGAVWRDGAAYMFNSKTTPSPDALFNSLVKTQSLRLVKGNLAASTPQIWTFQTSAPGMISRIQLSTSHDNNSAAAVPFQMLCELKNLTTGKTDWTKWLRYDLDSTNYAHAIELDFGIPFHGDSRYQLTMTPLNAPVNGTFFLNFAYTYSRVTFYSGSSTSGATFTQGYYCFEDCTEGLVILRCRSGGTGGKITFQWNGQVMEPVMVRDAAQDNMWKVQEYFFYRKGSIPKSNEFTVSFQCNLNGELWFYDWGGFFC